MLQLETQPRPQSDTGATDAATRYVNRGIAADNAEAHFAHAGVIIRV